MIINNIAINTLMLCFSCGCYKDGNGLGGDAGGSADCRATSSKMIVAKNITISDLIDDYTCDGNGHPLIYDLEPIKNIIRLHFNGQIQTYCNGTVPPPIGTRPTEPPGPGPGPGGPTTIAPPTKRPPATKEPPQPPNLNFTLLVIELFTPNLNMSIKIRDPFKIFSELIELFKQNPATQVYFLLTDGQDGKMWTDYMTKIIKKRGTQENPNVVVTIDWSAYSNKKQPIIELAKWLADIIGSTPFLGEQFTIIAPALSSNLAGLVGHILRTRYATRCFLGKIVAPDPKVNVFWEGLHILDRGDAKVVTAILTKPPPKGQTYTFEVRVNHINNPQPWCEDDDCSSITAIDILGTIIEQNFYGITFTSVNGTVIPFIILDHIAVLTYNPHLYIPGSIYKLIVTRDGTLVSNCENDNTCPDLFDSWEAGRYFIDMLLITQYEHPVENILYHFYIFSAQPDVDFSMTEYRYVAPQLHEFNSESFYSLIDWSRNYLMKRFYTEEEWNEMIEKLVNNVFKYINVDHLKKTIFIVSGVSGEIVTKLLHKIEEELGIRILTLIGVNANEMIINPPFSSIDVITFIPEGRRRMTEIIVGGNQLIINNPFRTQYRCPRFEDKCSEAFGVGITFQILKHQIDKISMSEFLEPVDFFEATAMQETFIDISSPPGRFVYVLNTEISLREAATPIIARSESSVVKSWHKHLDTVKETQEWIQKHPKQQIYVVLYNRAFLKWAQAYEYNLRNNSYILRFDLSALYLVNPDLSVNTYQGAITQIVTKIAEEIIERKVDINRLTIVSLTGDGAVGLVASLIARKIEENTGTKVHRLIISFIRNVIISEDQPRPEDAVEVIIIHVPQVYECCNGGGGSAMLVAHTILEACQKKHDADLDDESSELRECIIIKVIQLIIQLQTGKVKFQKTPEGFEVELWFGEIVPPGTYLLSSWTVDIVTPRVPGNGSIDWEPPPFKNSTDTDWHPTTDPNWTPGTEPEWLTHTLMPPTGTVPSPIGTGPTEPPGPGPGPRPKTIAPPTKRPPATKEPPQPPNLNFTLLVIELFTPNLNMSIKIRDPFKIFPELIELFKQNPATQVYFLLTDGQDGKMWTKHMTNIIKKRGTQENPNVVVTIDWSAYSNKKQPIIELAKWLADIIGSTPFLGEQFTIIAPALSSNLAGLVGDILRTRYATRCFLGKIVAPDPKVNVFWEGLHILDRGDAKVVTAILTKPPPKGQTYTFEVRVNDINNPQPWCEDDDCSSITAIDILGTIIEQNFYGITFTSVNGTVIPFIILDHIAVLTYNPHLYIPGSIYKLIVTRDGTLVSNCENDNTCPDLFDSWEAGRYFIDMLLITQYEHPVENILYHFYIFSAQPDVDFSMTEYRYVAPQLHEFNSESFYSLIDWSRNYLMKRFYTEEEWNEMIEKLVNNVFEYINVDHLKKTIFIVSGVSGEIVTKLLHKVEEELGIRILTLIGVNANEMIINPPFSSIDVITFIPEGRRRMTEITVEGNQLIINNPFRTQYRCPRFEDKCSEAFGVGITFQILKHQIDKISMSEFLEPVDFFEATAMQETFIDISSPPGRFVYVLNTEISLNEAATPIIARSESSVVKSWHKHLDTVKETQEWIQKHPKQQIYVVLYNRAFLKWAQAYEYNLRNNSYILRFDLSALYLVNPDLSVNTYQGAITQIVTKIAEEIIERKVDINRLTIVSLTGDGAVGLVASLIARRIEENTGTKVHRLIISFIRNVIISEDQPRAEDAVEVIIIHVPQVYECCNGGGGSAMLVAHTILEACQKKHDADLDDESSELRECIIIKVIQLIIQLQTGKVKFQKTPEGFEVELWFGEIVPPGTYLLLSWKVDIVTPRVPGNGSIDWEPPPFKNSTDTYWHPTTDPNWTPGTERNWVNHTLMPPTGGIPTESGERTDSGEGTGTGPGGRRTPRPLLTTTEHPHLELSVKIEGVSTNGTYIATEPKAIWEILKTFINVNPDGNFVIVFTSENSRANNIWGLKLLKTIIQNQRNQVPNLVIVIDVTTALKDLRKSDNFLRSTRHEAEQLMNFILSYNIVPERTKIIAFDYSVMIAHLFGKMVYDRNEQLNTIFELNPNTLLWDEQILTEALPKKNDAIQTVALFTTSNGTQCCDDTNVIININDCFDNFEERVAKPRTGTVVVCTLDVILENVIDIIIHKYTIKSIQLENVRIDWLLDVSPDHYGKFEVTTFELEIKFIVGYEVNTIVTEQRQIEKNMQMYSRKHPDGLYYFILTERGKADDSFWGQRVQFSIIKKTNGTTHVTVVAVPEFSEKAKAFYKALIKVGDKIIAFISHNNIPWERLRIVGYGDNAFLAVYLRMKLTERNQPITIILLNPPTERFDNSPSTIHLEADPPKVITIITTSDPSVFCCQLSESVILVDYPDTIHPTCTGVEEELKCMKEMILKSFITWIEGNQYAVTKDPTVEPQIKMHVLDITYEDPLGTLHLILTSNTTYNLKNITDQVKIIEGGYSIATIVKGRENVQASILEFQSQYTQGNYTIILDDRSTVNDSIWSHEVLQVILENKPGTHATVITYNNTFKDQTGLEAEERAKIVAKLLYEFIVESKIPPKRLNIFSNDKGSLVSYYLNNLFKEKNQFILLIVNTNPAPEFTDILIRKTEVPGQGTTKVINIISYSHNVSSIPPQQEGIFTMYINTVSSAVIQPECTDHGDQEACSFGVGLFIVIEALRKDIGASSLDNDLFIVNILELPPGIDRGEFLVLTIEIVPPPPPPTTPPPEPPTGTDEPGIPKTTTVRPKVVDLWEPPGVELLMINNTETHISIIYQYPNGTSILIDIKNIADDLIRFFMKPRRRIILMLINKDEHSDDTWPERIRDQLPSVAQRTEATIIPFIIDWTKESQLKYPTTRADRVARDVIRFLLRLKASPTETEIITFGESSHLAGAIGKLCKAKFQLSLYKIIAMQPTKSVEYSQRKVNSRLHESDAKQVLTIITETERYGECCGDEATIQVLVGNPPRGQPQCKKARKPNTDGDDDDTTEPDADPYGYQCSHEAATSIFITSYIKKPVKVVNIETDEQLPSFPYNVPTIITGIYHMPVDDEGEPVKESNETKPIQPPPVDGGIPDITFYYPNKPSETFNCSEVPPGVWENISISGPITLVITGGLNEHLSWIKELSINSKRIIIERNWDAFKQSFENQDFKIFDKVAQGIVHDIEQPKLDVMRMTIIGYGVSAHIAGLVGRILKEKSELPHQIIALNPYIAKAKKLPPTMQLQKTDAHHVLAILTQLPDSYICCEDIVNVMVNNPYTTQPACALGDLKCCAAFAITVLVQSAKLEGHGQLPLKHHSEKKLEGFPFNIETWNKGIYYYNTYVDGLSTPANKVTVLIVGGYDASILQMTSRKESFHIIKTFLGLKVNKSYRIYLVFDAGDQADKQWSSKMHQVIKNKSPVAALILVVPITVYPNIEQTVKWKSFVVRHIYSVLSKSGVEPRKLTVIGFGIGHAYVTALAQKYISEGKKISIDIGLNPVASLYAGRFGPPPGPDDADLVMNVHSEAKYLGHCCGKAHIDVLLNDPFSTVPNCRRTKNKPLCSFKVLAHYIIRAFGNLLISLPVLRDTNITLVGYPYNKNGTPGIYGARAYAAEFEGPVSMEDGKFEGVMLPPLVPPGAYENLPPIMREFGSRLYIVFGSGDHIDNVLYNLDILQHQLQQGSPLNAYIFPVPWDRSDAIMKSEVLKKAGSWSNFIKDPKSMPLLLEVARAEAKTMVDKLLENQVTFGKVTIIAHGENVLLATIVCKQIKKATDMVPTRVIYLNPLKNLFDTKLVPKNEQPSPYDGLTVLTISTETKEYGYSEVGGFDLFVDEFRIQPLCKNKTDPIYCTHNMALEYFPRFIEYQYNDADFPQNTKRIDGFPLNYAVTIQGRFQVTMKSKTSWAQPQFKTLAKPENLTQLDFSDIGNKLKEYPLYQLLIILADSHSLEHHPQWPEEVKKSVKQKTRGFRAKLFVHIVKWKSAVVNDKYPNHEAHIEEYLTSINYAQDIVAALNRDKIPPDSVNVLGFGPSAMMAHFIGKLYRPRQIIHLNPHFIWFQDYRHFYSFSPQYRITNMTHSPDEDIANSVMVIQSETRKYGYCCEAGHIQVAINNPVLGQVWCATDRLCSYMSIIPIFLDALQNAPARVFLMSDPSELLEGFPFWYDVDSRERRYILKTDYQGKVYIDPSGIVSPDESKAEFSITKEEINIWYKLNPNGLLFIAATDDTSGDRKWHRKLSKALKSINITNKVIPADYSRHIRLGITEETLNASRYLASAIGKIVEESDYPTEKTTILGFGIASMLASKIAKQMHILSENPIRQIFYLNPSSAIFNSTLVPEKDRPEITDANLVIIIETETSTLGKADSVEKAVRVIVNDPEKAPQPTCVITSNKDFYQQCSHRYAIPFFISSFLKPVSPKDKKGRTLKQFPYYVDTDLKGIGGVFYVNTSNIAAPPDGSPWPPEKYLESLVEISTSAPGASTKSDDSDNNYDTNDDENYNADSIVNDGG